MCKQDLAANALYWLIGQQYFQYYLMIDEEAIPFSKRTKIIYEK